MFRYIPFDGLCISGDFNRMLRLIKKPAVTCRNFRFKPNGFFNCCRKLCGKRRFQGHHGDTRPLMFACGFETVRGMRIDEDLVTLPEPGDCREAVGVRAFAGNKA